VVDRDRTIADKKQKLQKCKQDVANCQRKMEESRIQSKRTIELQTEYIKKLQIQKKALEHVMSNKPRSLSRRASAQNSNSRRLSRRASAQNNKLRSLSLGASPRPQRKTSSNLPSFSADDYVVTRSMLPTVSDEDYSLTERSPNTLKQIVDPDIDKRLNDPKLNPHLTDRSYLGSSAIIPRQQSSPQARPTAARATPS